MSKWRRNRTSEGRNEGQTTKEVIETERGRV